MIYSHALRGNTEMNGRQVIQIIALMAVESDVLDFIYFHEHRAVEAKLWWTTRSKALPQAESEDPRCICAPWAVAQLTWPFSHVLGNKKTKITCDINPKPKPENYWNSCTTRLTDSTTNRWSTDMCRSPDRAGLLFSQCPWISDRAEFPSDQTRCKSMLRLKLYQLSQVNNIKRSKYYFIYI